METGSGASGGIGAPASVGEADGDGPAVVGGAGDQPEAAGTGGQDYQLEVLACYVYHARQLGVAHLFTHHRYLQAQ